MKNSQITHFRSATYSVQQKRFYKKSKFLLIDVLPFWDKICHVFSQNTEWCFIELSPSERSNDWLNFCRGTFFSMFRYSYWHLFKNIKGNSKSVHVTHQRPILANTSFHVLFCWDCWESNLLETRRQTSSQIRKSASDATTSRSASSSFRKTKTQTAAFTESAH